MNVTIEMQDDVAVIVMDDGKANAINHELLDGLDVALDKAKTEAKAIIIAGRPGRFSAGFDLNIMRDAPEVDIDGLVNRGGKFLLRLLTYPMPVVAACSGHAIAMGAFILLACDTRVGVEGDFKIGANETAINMRLPVFGFELPRARLRREHYTNAILHSTLYDPRRAIDVGYLDSIVAPTVLMETVIRSARTLGELSGDAFIYNKLGVRREEIRTIRASLNAP